MESGLWETMGMAKPETYVTKVMDPVTLEGTQGRLIVVDVDATKNTARVSTTSTPIVVHIVEWSKLSYLDERPNAARIVREATEQK